MDGYCPRLLDYLLIVGSSSSCRTGSDTEVPVILSRYPPKDHPDFVLPSDVAYFCQPEGCVNTSVFQTREKRSTPSSKASTFVFTITDKDSSKVRYGICLNFMRPFRRYSKRIKRQFLNDWTETPSVSTNEDGYEGRNSLTLSHSKSSAAKLHTHTLTSLCILTHHPCFTNFKILIRLIYDVLQRLNEYGKSHSQSRHFNRESIWSVLTNGEVSVNSSVIFQCVHEFEMWILRLLSTPSPTPGKSCVYLNVAPNCPQKPLLFGLPDSSRLPLVDFRLHLPIQIMGVAKTLRILVCLLLEQKVVVQSDDYEKLSECVLAFTALLYPLQYMFPIIPLLPPCMPEAEQLLIAPTPYIIGVPSAFYAMRKVFRMPKDVWLVNLDTQEFDYPSVLEEVPDLPEPECSLLAHQLTSALSVLPKPVRVSNFATLNTDITRLILPPAFKDLPKYNPLAHLTDEDSVSVATRVSMVLFLFANNILGGLTEHTRILRLFPRPVVAFQFENFMRSRPKPSLFTSMLAKTQAVEYFAEHLVHAENEAFQRIQDGVYSAELLGDQAKWFASELQAVHFTAWPDQPQLDLLSAALSAAVEQLWGSLGNSNASDTGAQQTVRNSQDDFSDLPTDESASDTDTERSTPSIGSTISDLTSECLDSGIAEEHNRVIHIRADVSSNASDKQAVIRPGQPLPSSLAVYFDPPSEPVLTTSAVVDPSSSTEVPSTVLLEDSNEEPSSEDTQLPHSSSSSSLRPQDRDGMVRGLARLAVNMFNGAANARGAHRLDSLVVDGKVNWQSPYLLILGDLLSPSGKFLTAPSDASNSELKKRLEEEQYLMQVANTIEAGSLPNLFARNRVASMMEREANRNLVLARLNRNFRPEANLRPGPHIEDVPLSNWNQYKSLVWMLRQMTQGLQVSLRSDLFIPTPANVHADANNRSLESRPMCTSGGGLSSAFTLLEIAHTHFYRLQRRQLRSPLMFNSQPTSPTGHSKNPPDLSEPSTPSSDHSAQVANPTFSLTDDPKPPEHRRTGSDPTFAPDPITTVDGTYLEELPPLKSACTRGFRYRRAHLIQTDLSLSPQAMQQVTARLATLAWSTQLVHRQLSNNGSNEAGYKVDRTYVFEDLINGTQRDKLWDNVQFWEDAFLDTVAQERDILGMDFRPRELLARYQSASALKRKAMELEEDRLLACLMHNMIAFMVMMRSDVDVVRRKIRRLLAKSHLGLHFSQVIGNLLDSLDVLHGNDIDLKPLQSRTVAEHSYEARGGLDGDGPLVFIEVSPDYLLLRNLSGCVQERWWYDQIVNVTFRMQTRLISITLRIHDQTVSKVFKSDKCRLLYDELTKAIEQVALQTPRGPLASRVWTESDLGGELNVVNLDSQKHGTLKVCSNGFAVKFDNQSNFIPMKYVKRCCSPQPDLFTMEVYDPEAGCMTVHRYKTDMAVRLLFGFSLIISNHTRNGNATQDDVFSKNPV